MRICVILEGCYPYVTGGVSSWMHQYIQAMPQHEFVIFAIGANSEMKGKFRYTLPENVVEVKEVFLGDALKLQGEPKKYRFSEAETKVLRDFINCDHPDWDRLFDMYSRKGIEPLAFLQSEAFLDILTAVCEEDYPYAMFSDMFHTVRSMLLPVLHLLSGEVPKADFYHSIATGYGGLLARLGSYRYGVPYEITEHGIYTREREEEIIRAKWVNPTFKKLWVKFFYMLSDAAYEKASKVTSLFRGAMNMQLEMGCAPEKCTYIVNGIHYEQFCGIPPKAENGYCDIGAVLRIAPIKDVKTMIHAYAAAKKRVPELRLFIAGPEDDKAYARECYELIELLGAEDIRFLGTVNVREWLGQFDFTMLSSISEGMPLSILESFAAGVPVISTDVGSCRELVGGISQDDPFGEAGIIVPPINARRMADAMVTMATDRARRLQMGRAGKQRVERYFLHQDMIARYQAVYDEVLQTWQA